jgi:predicted nucleic acid-binding protein
VTREFVVVDASVVVAALLGAGRQGRWAERVLSSGPLAAPQLMPAEVDNILRKALAAGKVSADAASLAHADLKALSVELYPYEPFADRIWELRANVSCYDAWYVALAEFLGCPLATLDWRLANSSGVKCGFVLPDDPP